LSDTAPLSSDPQLGQLLQSQVSLLPSRWPVVFSAGETIFCLLIADHFANGPWVVWPMVIGAGLFGLISLVVTLRMLYFRRQLARTVWHCYEHGVVRVRGTEQARIHAAEIASISYRCEPTRGYPIWPVFLLERIDIALRNAANPWRIELRSKPPESYGQSGFTGPLYGWVEIINRQIGS